MLYTQIYANNDISQISSSSELLPLITQWLKLMNGNCSNGLLMGTPVWMKQWSKTYICAKEDYNSLYAPEIFRNWINKYDSITAKS